MSLQPSAIEPVPEETVRVAHAAFPKGNLYLAMRDELGTLFSDSDFVSLYPKSLHMRIVRIEEREAPGSAGL